MKLLQVLVLVLAILLPGGEILAEDLDASVGLELDAKGRRWIITLGEGLRSRTDLSIELEVQSEQATEVLNFLAWETTGDPGIFTVRLDRIPLSVYGARAVVQGRSRSLPPLNLSSDWVHFSPNTGIKLKKQVRDDFADGNKKGQGLMLTLLAFSWLVVLSNWISLKTTELKAGFKNNSSNFDLGPVSPKLLDQLILLRTSSGRAKRELNETESQLFGLDISPGTFLSKEKRLNKHLDPDSAGSRTGEV